MTIDSAHVPTPEFRAQLEWEVTRAARRQGRLGAQARTRRRLRAAAVVAVSVAVGTMTGLASAQVRDVARRDSLLTEAQVELRMAQIRLDLSRSIYEDAVKKVKVGAASTESLLDVEAELRAMEGHVARAALNIDEIRASLQVARDELNAPLVDGRDFVKERMQIDLRSAQAQLLAAERTLREVEPRVRAGAAPDIARVEAELGVERARRPLAILAERLSLRQEFIEKGTPADQLFTRLEVAELKQDARLAQRALDLARLRLTRLEGLRAAGAVAEIELLRARVEAKERELELSRVAMQLRRLDLKKP
jgi:hypothetical protein